jgi:hypothetical protein
MFKLHTTVMNSKSTWFAKQCQSSAPVGVKTVDILDDGLTAHPLESFKHPQVVACDLHQDDAPGTSEQYLTSMLHFCYLGEYPPKNGLWRAGSNSVLLLLTCLYVPSGQTV